MPGLFAPRLVMSFTSVRTGGGAGLCGGVRSDWPGSDAQAIKFSQLVFAYFSNCAARVRRVINTPRHTCSMERSHIEGSVKSDVIKSS